MNERKTVFKIFTAWRYRAEEAWLERMSLEGWHLASASLGFYRFSRGEPEGFAYRLDYQGKADSMSAEYRAIFADAGCEHVASFTGWHYFRSRKNDGAFPEIYSDAESKAEMHKRVLGLLLTAFLVNLFFAMQGLFRLPSIGTSIVETPVVGWIMAVVHFLNFLCAILLGYGTYKMRRFMESERKA